VGNKKTGVAIFAAGFSERFNGKKLRTYLGEKPLLQWVIDKVSESCVDISVVIVNDTFSKHSFDLKNLDIIINEKPQEGISRSVFLALNWALKNEIDGLFLTTGDMPFIKPEDFEFLIEKSEQYRDSVISCSYKHVKGFPTFIPEKYFFLMNDLEGDQGFSQIIKKYKLPHKMIERTWRNVFDIDTKKDFEEAKELLKYV
jgi:molybdenum cofactor cytidylyltransferase